MLVILKRSFVLERRPTEPHAVKTLGIGRVDLVDFGRVHRKDGRRQFRHVRGDTVESIREARHEVWGRRGPQACSNGV